MEESLTIPERLLIAADSLEQQGQTPFTAEALVVAAWRKFPRAFGLKNGFEEQYPDSNRVLSALMGYKGLVRRGWFLRIGEKTYTLTKEGRRALQIVRGEEVAPETSVRQRLPRELDLFADDLLASVAIQKFEESRVPELTFADACRFWNITEAMDADAIDAALHAVADRMRRLEMACADADMEMRSGRVLTAADVRVLSHVHRHLDDRFERHLKLMRSRLPKRQYRRRRAEAEPCRVGA